MSDARVPDQLDWSYQGITQRVARRREFASPMRVCIWTVELAQAVAIAAAAVAAKYIYIDLYLGQAQPLIPYLALVPVLVFALSMFYSSMGVDDVESLIKPTVGFGKVWGGLTLAFLVLLGGLYLFKTAEFYSRGWFLSWFGLSAIGIVYVRMMAMRRVKSMFKSGRLRKRIALYGSPKYLDAIKKQLDVAGSLGRANGLYFDEPERDDSGPATLHGGLQELQQSLEWGAYDTVIIGLPSSDSLAIRDAVRGLGPYSPEILLCTDLTHDALMVHGSRTIGRLQANVVSQMPASENGRVPKRILDTVVSLAALVVLSPILLIVALLIKLESPGPVLFVQRRYGRNNKVFGILKFRSMTVTENGDKVTQATRNDPRVTRIGRILRATSFDEVPQLINVLRGEMSVVGPRPHALAHDDAFERQLDRFSTRKQVLPGLTGWAQVSGYRGETRTTDDIRRRMQCDLYYIENWSIWFDIEIMVRTFATLIRGAY